jgi:hypothetical protein
MSIKIPPGRLFKRNDPKRVWRSFRRHTLLVLQPLGVTGFVLIIWIQLRSLGIHLAEEDLETMTVAIINTLAIIFSLIYAVVVSTIWENYRKIGLCILREDKETFLLYRDERIPIVMYLLLAAASFPLVVIVMFLAWHTFWSGFLGVFFVTFAISFLLIGAAELQDPKKSPWMAERIPDDWFTEDVDERFYDGEEET